MFSVKLYVEKRHGIKYKRALFALYVLHVSFREIYFVSSIFEISCVCVVFVLAPISINEFQYMIRGRFGILKCHELFLVVVCFSLFVVDLHDVI